MRRSRRQAAGRRKDSIAGRRVPQLPWTVVRNPYPPMEIARADDVEAIHDASMRVLEEIGVNILLEEARDILKTAGVAVTPGEPRVRFDRGFIEESVAHA